MSKEIIAKYPQLCPGVIFKILSEYCEDHLAKKEGFSQKKDPNANNLRFTSLAGITDQKYKNQLDDSNSLSTDVSNFINCRTNIPPRMCLKTSIYQSELTGLFMNEYPLLLWRIHEYLEKYVRLFDGDKPRKYVLISLVKSILEIINNDPACKDVLMPIGPNGEEKNPLEESDIFFQSFILGIWYYTVTQCRDNTVDEQLFNTWADYPHKGASIEHDIKLVIQTVSEPQEAKIETKSFESTSSEDSDSASTNQSMAESNNKFIEDTPQATTINKYINVAINNGTMII